MHEVQQGDGGGGVVGFRRRLLTALMLDEVTVSANQTASSAESFSLVKSE